MPFIACLLKIADELDITNMRTPDLIVKYYHPQEAKGIDEFEKHRSLTKINRQQNILHIIGRCESNEIYNILSYEIKKIDGIIGELEKMEFVRVLS